MAIAENITQKIGVDSISRQFLSFGFPMAPAGAAAALP